VHLKTKSAAGNLALEIEVLNMKFKNLVFTAGGILSLTVISIALVTIYYLGNLETLESNAIRLESVRRSALMARFHIVQIQQFLTDASVTGDEEGIDKAKENLQSLEETISMIEKSEPHFASAVDGIKSNAQELLKVGIEMTKAYIGQGREAGNAIMKRPETGLDALSEKLSEEMGLLEQKATNLQVESSTKVQTTQHILLIQTIILSLIELVILVASFWAIFRRTKPLEKVVNHLSENAVCLEDASNSVSGSANALSAANTQQAAATHETAASLEEIRAMVGKTAENSHFLQARAEETNESVQLGKQALDAVVATINEISLSQHNIFQSVEQTNQEVGKIVNLVSEIGNKTKVINEIVFQTKLLSFNASVEAARAGENGRGFAVVAEEVGSLAQMSGNAAKEISDLLDASTQQVKTIIEEGRKRLAVTVQQSTKKIDEGVDTAHRCGESFETIISQMHAVNSTTAQTSSAIQETVKGLDEIAKALEDLDNSTRSNTQTSMEATSTSIKLTEQLNTLKKSIDEINHVIAG
jgi:methyl-accepting chemotaxis protein